MKREERALMVAAIANTLISAIKIFTGIFGNCVTLISDGMNTAAEIIVDIISLLGIHISKRKPNRLHPFGYGRAEYIANIFISALIFVLGIYIITDSFSVEVIKPDYRLTAVIFIVILIKLCTIIYLNSVGRKHNSAVLVTTSEVATSDLKSTLFVAVIILMSQLEDIYPIFIYLDNIGSIVIGLDVLYMGYKIARDNGLALMGEKCNDRELLNEIKNDLTDSIDKKIIDDVYLVKYGAYFKSTVRIRVNQNMRILDYKEIEKKIKRILRKKKYNIKYINVEILDRPTK